MWVERWWGLHFRVRPKKCQNPFLCHKSLFITDFHFWDLISILEVGQNCYIYFVKKHPHLPPTATYLHILTTNAKVIPQPRHVPQNTTTAATWLRPQSNPLAASPIIWQFCEEDDPHFSLCRLGMMMMSVTDSLMASKNKVVLGSLLLIFSSFIYLQNNL